MANPLQSIIGQIGRKGDIRLRRSQLARKYFLNPQMPRALRNDPDGKWHFEQQISDEKGRPIPNIKKGDPLPLTLRWYQQEVVDDDSKRKVLRFGRRTGKSFTIAVDVCVEAVTNPNAKILILTPNEAQVKMLFDDYIRPLLRAYRHQGSTAVGIERRLDAVVPAGHDFVITTDTKKPQEIVITDGKNHNVSIRGMVITNAARGQSATYVVIDEADYADDEGIQAIVAPIMMTSAATRVMMGSTPTGRTTSYYYRACNDKTRWKEFKRDFTVLPHFDQKLWDDMAAMAGGENTNTFKQEYLAEWGTEAEGVFDAKALNLSFILCPWIRVLEDVNPRTRERTPLYAATAAQRGRFMEHWAGAQPWSWDVGGYTEIGAESLWRPGLPGIITVGTDWNEHAGMQTIITWWPDRQWLAEGHLKVARFDYEKGIYPNTNGRARDKQGRVREFVVGSDNGQPGGPHDLSQVEGIVIWHGRLEAGQFNWQVAANRAIAMMAIPDFIDAWYVDYGYGAQVLKLIEGIMDSGQYMSDGLICPKAKDIEPQLMKNILQFHPDQDRSGRIFKSINFSKPYPYLDFGYAERGDLTKDVLIGITKRKLIQRKILIPYGELFRFAKEDELGSHVVQEFDGKAFGEEKRIRETNRDMIELTGADEPRGSTSFGGLVHQMRTFRQVGTTPTGRPRYEGADHAIDALMLSILAYVENYEEATADNVARKDSTFRSAQAESLLKGLAESAVVRHKPVLDTSRMERQGDFHLNNYKGDYRAPLHAITSGEKRPEEVGVSLQQMLRQAARHIARKTGSS